MQDWAGELWMIPVGIGLGLILHGAGILVSESVSIPIILAGVLLMGFGVFGVVRSDRRTKQTRKSGRGHQVTVNEVVSPEIPLYYVAICECGWLGDTHPTSDIPFREAHEHSGSVDPELKKPLEEP